MGLTCNNNTSNINIINIINNQKHHNNNRINSRAGPDTPATPTPLELGGR